MSDDARLALSVTHADGSVKRWGADEANGGDIPGDLTFSTSVPGGFTSLNCSLLREIEPRADEYLFDTVKAYGPGGRTAWEGRIAQLPRAGGRSARLEPGAVGWSSHLEDDQSFRAVYVDRDPGAWTEATLARRIITATAGNNAAKISASSSSDGLRWEVPAEALAVGVNTEMMYTAPAGVNIASIGYTGAQTGSFTNIENPTLYGSASRDLATPNSVALTLDGVARAAALPAARRYLMMHVHVSFAVTPPAGTTRTFSKIAVYGNHGLTLRSVGDGVTPDGVYASDVVANALASAAPLLTYTTGATGTIQPTTFVIPHLAFKEPTTAADVIATANAYHGWDWAVWDNKTFYYNPAGSGTQWQARIGDGAQLSLEGDTADQIINGVVVSYQDGGISKLAGPVGSGCDVTSSSLQDSSTDNPATAHSITKKWPVLPISFPTTDAGAVQLGAIYLAERNLASRKGTLTLSGSVRHPTEGMVPCWRVRAGDTVVVSDQAGSPIRRIIATSYTHASRTTQLTLDSTAHKLDALLARILATSPTY